jgi:DNA helicase-2/ATP-dependent DNA helicase PcrA
MLHNDAPPSFQDAREFHIDYQGELNAQQYQAVTALPGPALVVAGAGAGKTRTLTYRVAYLLEQGIPAHRILLLTFTNKAAGEMMQRVTGLLGREEPALWGGTFHSIGNRLLRRHAEALGYQRDFTILDREDARHLISACRAERALEHKGETLPKADALADIFSLAVNTNQSIPEILARQFQHLESPAEPIIDLSRGYSDRKRSANVMDFDDLLTLWLELFQSHTEICEQYQRQFQFILVDEYQDTNALQSKLIDLLAARHHNIMVVGDDAQSIYSWRGANFRNLLQFPERYPQAAIYRIETNYRSSPEILDVANAAIAANVAQFAKHLTPARPSGAKPMVVSCADAREQSAFIANKLVELRAAGVLLQNVAILYRSHFHALEIQMELTRRSLPFSVTSGIRFFEQAHIKDVTAYLRLVVNPRDEVAFKRLVQFLPGIGAKGAQKLWRQFLAAKSPQPAEPARPPSGDPMGPESSAPPTAEANSELAFRLRACSGSISAKTKPVWTTLTQTLQQLEAELVRQTPSRLIQMVLDAGYEAYAYENYDNAYSRLDDLAQLVQYALSFESLPELLAQLSLLSNVEAEGSELGAPEREKVRLSTIHQAKGLEFDVVFVIMLCEGLFPSSRSLEDKELLEEERRLFYVAITRARNQLYLCHPLLRVNRGEGGASEQAPSRFLLEIADAGVEQWGRENFNPGYDRSFGRW